MKDRLMNAVERERQMRGHLDDLIDRVVVELGPGAGVKVQANYVMHRLVLQMNSDVIVGVSPDYVEGLLERGELRQMVGRWFYPHGETKTDPRETETDAKKTDAETETMDWIRDNWKRALATLNSSGFWIPDEETYLGRSGDYERMRALQEERGEGAPSCEALCVRMGDINEVLGGVAEVLRPMVKGYLFDVVVGDVMVGYLCDDGDAVTVVVNTPWVPRPDHRVGDTFRRREYETTVEVTIADIRRRWLTLALSDVWAQALYTEGLGELFVLNARMNLASIGPTQRHHLVRDLLGEEG